MTDLAERINQTSAHIEHVIENLHAYDEATSNPRLVNKILAVEKARSIWEQLRDEANEEGKLAKVHKRFARYLDYEVKHTNGGVNQGYTVVLDHVRVYL